MSGSADVFIINNSGVSIDKIALWHTPNAPDFSSLQDKSNLVVKASEFNADPSVPLKGRASLISFDPEDFWTMAVLFHGDGTWYVMCGDSLSPYKEFEVDDGRTIKFKINEYLRDSTNQSNIDIEYTGDPGMALLWNQELVDDINLVVEIMKVLAEIFGEDLQQE